MTPEKAKYIRSLSKDSLGDFKLSALWRFSNARRGFSEARAELEERRAELRFIEQVLKERALGNIVEFPVATEAVPTKKRKWRRA